MLSVAPLSLLTSLYPSLYLFCSPVPSRYLSPSLSFINFKLVLDESPRP